MNYYNSNQMSTVSPYDRKTKALNKLINGLFKKEILSENSTLRALYLVKSYTHCYTIVFDMDGDYRNEGILIDILVSTVDKILEWWDITDSYNLDVEYITRGRRPINKNYFELLFHSYNSRGNIRGYNPDGVDNFHPRFTKMCSWMYKHKPNEYEAAMNRSYDPYRYRENPQAQEFRRQRAQFRGEGIQPGEYNVVMGGEQFYQQVLDQQRELLRGQMSLRWSDYGTNNPCAEIELPNVTVKQRVSKLNKLLNKLKL